jgi:hypothetical protein
LAVAFNVWYAIVEFINFAFSKLMCSFFIFAKCISDALEASNVEELGVVVDVELPRYNIYVIISIKL